MFFKSKQLLWFGLFCLLVIVPLMFIDLPITAQSYESQLKTFLNENQATPDERKAYMFALRNPEALKVIPCYCGCGKQGHKHNYNCFMKDSVPKNAKNPFDDHGLVCPMCVQIALFTEEQLALGVPLSQIRQYVDDAMKKHPNLHATPTPKPKQKH